jgi:hypothetical protein
LFISNYTRYPQRQGVTCSEQQPQFELQKRIRSAGFCTKGPRVAFHLRKMSGGVNTALDDARSLVREILGETE